MKASISMRAKYDVLHYRLPQVDTASWPSAKRDFVCIFIKLLKLSTKKSGLRGRSLLRLVKNIDVAKQFLDVKELHEM
uniref:Uncharacterized protein n=1 Tax=Glossina pallidipes TaxID=7398 RepID=A0A1B0ACJ5_GLOPL